MYTLAQRICRIMLEVVVRRYSISLCRHRHPKELGHHAVQHPRQYHQRSCRRSCFAPGRDVNILMYCRLDPQLTGLWIAIRLRRLSYCHPWSFWEIYQFSQVESVFHRVRARRALYTTISVKVTNKHRTRERDASEGQRIYLRNSFCVLKRRGTWCVMHLPNRWSLSILINGEFLHWWFGAWSPESTNPCVSRSIYLFLLIEKIRWVLGYYVDD